MAGFLMTVEFVRQRLSILNNVVESWGIKNEMFYDNKFYKLNLRMSGLTNLNWDALKRADRYLLFYII